MKGGTSTEAAWKATDARLHQGDASALGAAQLEVSAAAEALSRLAGRQEQVRQSGGDQTQLAGQVAQAESAARTALTDARSGSTLSDQPIDQAMGGLRDRTASTAATKAATSQAAGDRSQADHAMQDASQAMHDDAAKMGQVAQALAREQAAAGDLGQGGLDARTAAGIAGKLAGALGSADHAVVAAAGALAPSGVLGDAGRLARLKQLTDSIKQARKNAGEGRTPGNPDLVGGAGSAAGGGAPMHGHGHHGGGRMTSFNRAVYEAFVKDLTRNAAPSRERLCAGERGERHRQGIAAASIVPIPAAVWADAMPKDDSASAPAARTLPTPTFKSPAFGAAGMVENPLTIDGDLNDWGTLVNPLTCHWHANSTTADLENGTQVYMRWSNEGLYFAYVVHTSEDIHFNKDMPYLGDCLEVWIDCQDARSETMGKSKFTHQFCFDPFGYKGDANCTFIEIGRDQRGMKQFQSYPDASGKRGRAAAKRFPGGYSVECFVARTTLARPVLVPGEYLAVNVSVNTGYDVATEQQWSASKALNTWDRPVTWGDVLLLGSDATVKALNADDSACTQVVPGQILQVEVTDKDMNMDPLAEERVLASVSGPDGDPVLMVLKETGQNTGVFRGSLNTSFYLDQVAPDTLRVRPGDVIEVGYDDPRAAYGEQHRHCGVKLPVAHPVMRLAALDH